jgi:hypothetical protein
MTPEAAKCLTMAAFCALAASRDVLTFAAGPRQKAFDMSHRRAVALMVLVTLLWSIAGVVSRHLDSAGSFEVTFWRSAVQCAGAGMSR